LSAAGWLRCAAGDDRANNVRRKYGRPLKAVVILGSGVLPAPAATQ
jgi:peptidyl-prolyl cis-trans isomerase B (cyclophilin B)